MNPDHAADIGRRALLAALGGAAGVMAGMEPARALGADARPSTSQMRTVQDEYRRLVPLWQENANASPIPPTPTIIGWVRTAKPSSR